MLDPDRALRDGVTSLENVARAERRPKLLCVAQGLDPVYPGSVPLWRLRRGLLQERIDLRKQEERREPELANASHTHPPEPPCSKFSVARFLRFSNLNTDWCLMKLKLVLEAL